MSGNDDGFVTAAAAFVDAARELKALHEHAQELATVGESLRSAEATATAMVEKATDALGEARKQLTQGAAETSALTEQVSNLISALAANLERISSLIENVAQLDPGKIRRDLDDMTRSISDNAAELREVRRELSDIRRDASSLGEAAERTNQQSAQLRSEVDSISDGQRALTLQLTAGMALIVVLLVAAIVVSL